MLTLAPVNPAHFVDLKGKRYVLYAGLLDAAHRSGLRSISTRLVQAPSDANGHTAIVHARATLVDGDDERYLFDGVGDANATNTNRGIALHAIRMAETRAKARALRDALNIGEAAVEELADEAPAQPRPAARPTPAAERGASPLNPSTPEQRARVATLRALLGLEAISAQALSYDQAAHAIRDLEATAAGTEISEAKYANLIGQITRIHAAYGVAVDLPDGAISVAQYEQLIRRLRAIEAQHKQPASVGK